MQVGPPPRSPAGRRASPGAGAGLGTGNDQTRRHNLSAALTALHHSGPQTRAELTRLLGLNRSTIAALVGELAELGLAHETAPTSTSGVGRPSPTVHPGGGVAAIAVNPDTDAVTVGLVALGGGVLRRIRRETSTAPTVAETLDLVESAVAELQRDDGLAAGFRIAGVGVAVPGLVRSHSGVVTLAPHLDWHDEPLADLLAERLGRAVVVANDANLAVVAESIYGAAKGVDDLVYLNGSSGGIGGGVLVGGRPLLGADGFGAELGHTSAPGAGLHCHCGRTGCLETEVSLDRLLAVLGVSAVDGDELDRLLTETADPALAAEVHRQLDVLSVVLADYVSVFNPARIVLGGFLGSLHAARPARLEAAVRASSFGPLAENLTIERAVLRTRLPLVGAAEAAFGALLGDPAGVVPLPLRRVP
jgi:predicted NBD/HSP70 family sugar kinase